MQLTVLVVGSGGQLGIEVVREFEKRSWNVVALDRRALDITNAEAVEHAISSAVPQVVVNAAAYNQVDRAEADPTTAYMVNALAVRHLAVSAHAHNAQLVQYSTDYVFDGRKGSPYLETDATFPTGAYAVSKLAGELYARAYVENALILRTSGVFGPAGLFTSRSNFPELMLKLAAEGKAIRVVDDHVASPSYAPAMAARTVDLVENGAAGIYHLGGGEPISWYEYAKLIFTLGEVEADLSPTDERSYKTAARRPKFSALSNEKVEAAGIAPMPPLRDAVAEYLIARTRATTHRV